MIAPKTRNKLRDQLIRDEGLRLTPYRDSVGKLTIGVGHNLDDKPISKSAALKILRDDIRDTIALLHTTLPWTPDLDPARLGVLLNMAFNLGIWGLLKFEKMLSALQHRDYTTAAKEMKDSIWYTQVYPRSERLIKQMLIGEWQ